MSIAHCSAAGHQQEESAFVFSHTHLHGISKHWQSPPSLLFLRPRFLEVSPSPFITDGPALSRLHGSLPFAQLCCPLCSCLSCTGEHSSETAARWVSSVPGKDQFTWLPGNALPNAAQEAVGTLFHWSTVLVHEQFECPHFLTRCFPASQSQGCAGACVYSSNRRMACHSTFC